MPGKPSKQNTGATVTCRAGWLPWAGMLLLAHATYGMLLLRAAWEPLQDLLTTPGALVTQALLVILWLYFVTCRVTVRREGSLFGALFGSRLVLWSDITDWCELRADGNYATWNMESRWLEIETPDRVHVVSYVLFTRVDDLRVGLEDNVPRRSSLRVAEEQKQ